MATSMSRASVAVALLMAVAAGAQPVAALGDTSAQSAVSSRSPSAGQLPGPHRSYPVWRGGHASLPGHTVLRPAVLEDVPYRMPVVVWANGGCRESNEEFRYFLRTFASYGTFIVANGAPDNPYEPTELTGVARPRPELLTQAIDWAVTQNADRQSPYYRRLDPGRVLVMGQSCGGWEAVDASSDRRVTSTILWNSGTNPHHPTGVFDLHAPLLVAHGERSDTAAQHAVATYEAAAVPAVLISHPAGGHTNWWDDPPEGSAPSAAQRVPGPIAAAWMAMTLYGSEAGRRHFLGPACGLCSQDGWSVSSKNWSSAGRR